MDIIYLGDVAAPQLSLQTLKALSGDELYRYYRLGLQLLLITSSNYP
jgi:hypothetical protein